MHSTHTTRTTTRTLLLALLAALALVLSACASDGGDTADGEVAETTDDAATDAATGDAATDAATGEDDTSGATVAVASSDLGDIVVDGAGRTLYVFVPDDQGDPTCTDDCAATWPPLEGPATAGEGVDGSLLATAPHPSGATQVTYGDWPLYHFANDAAPGDVNGQGVNDVWFVVGADGEPIRDASAASSDGLGY